MTRPRLFDDIMNNRVVQLGPNISAQFKKAPIIVCDEVTEYYYALSDKEVWDITDFPNVAPPFESFWIETSRPSKIQSEEFGELAWESDGNLRPTRWGALFYTVPKEHLTNPEKGGVLFTQWDLMQFEWLLEVVMFVQRPGYAITPIWAWSIPVTKEGAIWPKHDTVLNKRVAGLSYSLIPDVKKLVDPVRARQEITKEIEDLFKVLNQPGMPTALPKVKAAQDWDDGVAKYDEHRGEAHGYLHPFLLAISFMHCKNVVMKTRHPDAKWKKKRQASGKITSSYRTIEVGPIKRMLEAAKQPGESGIKMALHRCRGHFKTYTEEKPLLGRAVGTFFWDSHVRGTRQKGEVKSDYNVHKPEVTDGQDSR